jgi:hypothetical protein
MFRAKRRSPTKSPDKQDENDKFAIATATLPSPSSRSNQQNHHAEQPRRISPKQVKKQLFRRKKMEKQGFREWCTLYKSVRLLAILGAIFFVISCSFTFLTARFASTQGSNGRLSVLTDNKPASKFQLYSKGAPECVPLTSTSQVTFTVVTQFSENRLWMMEHHCRRWKRGPISIAVLTGRTAQQVQLDLVRLGCAAEHVSVQTVSHGTEEDYPVNLLRNIAIAAVKTTHVVYVDVDFWESSDLFETLQLHRETLMQDFKTALVLPAFQLNRQCKEWKECPEKNVPVMPHGQDELLDLIYETAADRFDPTNAGGHGSTRYVDWMDQTASQLIPIECVLSNRYEPYLVFRYCRDVPPFQEAFTGYGKNKMTWVMHLRRAGWKFWQVGHSFVVHYPHLDSKARMRWNGGKNGIQLRKPVKSVDWLAFKRGQIDSTFLAFRKWLHEQVPDQTQIPMCQGALNDDERLWVDRESKSK